MKTVSILVVVALFGGCSTMTTSQPNAQEALLAPEIAKFVTAPSGSFIVLKGPSQPEHSRLVTETKRILAKRYVIYDSIDDVPAGNKRVDPTQSLHVDLINGIVFHYGLWPRTGNCVQISHVSDTQEQARAWVVTSSCWSQGKWQIGKTDPLVTF